METFKNHPFTVGNFHCIAMNDGFEPTPFETVLKGVADDLISQALVARGNLPCDAITFFNCLYIETGQKRILVDAGWGQGTQRRHGVLLESLQADGISPAEIDFLVITHGDVDHIGGILTSENQLTFPNAKVVLLKEAWDFWCNDALVARWPVGLTVFGRTIFPLIRDRVQIIENGQEFLPGLRLIHAPGHRPGHTVIAVESNGEHLYHLADTVGHAILMEHPEWTWTMDARPELAVNDKKSLLQLAADQNARVFGSHLPFPGVGRLIAQGDGWRWEPDNAN